MPAMSMHCCKVCIAVSITYALCTHCSKDLVYSSGHSLWRMIIPEPVEHKPACAEDCGHPRKVHRKCHFNASRKRVSSNYALLHQRDTAA